MSPKATGTSKLAQSEVRGWLTKPEDAAAIPFQSRLGPESMLMRLPSVAGEAYGTGLSHAARFPLPEHPELRRQEVQRQARQRTDRHGQERQPGRAGQEVDHGGIAAVVRRTAAEHGQEVAQALPV